MTKDKPKDDASDKAPRPVSEKTPVPPSKRQDAPNYEDREDGGRVIPTEDISSANDE